MKALIGQDLANENSIMPDFLIHVKMVAGIILSVSLFASTILVGMVLMITHEPDVSYSETFFNYNLTRERLLPALLVAGLCIVVLSACMTWLISIYSSFRIAGPLYRISESLISAIKTDSTPEFNFRQDDFLEDKTLEIRRNIATFNDFECEIENLREQISQALCKDVPDIETAAKSLAALQEEVRRVRI